MKYIVRPHRFLVCLVAALLISGCSDEQRSSAPPAPPDPVAEGERLMRSMSETLAKAKTFAFETSEQLEVTAATGEKNVVSFTRKAAVRRPNGLAFEIKGKDEVPLEVEAFYDGKTVTLNNRAISKWAQTAVPGTLDEMLDDVAKRFGLPVPIGDVVYSSPYDAFIGPNTKGRVAGEETIGGAKFARLEYDDEYIQLKIWLPASGQPLPRRIEMLYKKAPTPMTARIEFTKWDLNATADDAMFVFKPPANGGEVDFGHFTSGLLARVVPAPQVAATPDPGAKTNDKPKAQ